MQLQSLNHVRKFLLLNIYGFILYEINIKEGLGCSEQQNVRILNNRFTSQRIKWVVDNA